MVGHGGALIKIMGAIWGDLKVLESENYSPS
jgi:hypothetical protein